MMYKEAHLVLDVLRLLSRFLYDLDLFTDREQLLDLDFVSFLLIVRSLIVGLSDLLRLR